MIISEDYEASQTTSGWKNAALAFLKIFIFWKFITDKVWRDTVLKKKITPDSNKLAYWFFDVSVLNILITNPEKGFSF